MMKIMRLFIFLLIIIPLLLAGCSTDSDVAVTEGEVRVVRVIDGDTIEIEGGERVRYIGIDTPEVYPETEPWGPEATDMNEELVGGRVVELRKDVTDRDRYGRLLRYVFVDGLFVNGELVRLGYARAVSYPPDTGYQDLLTQLEEEAKEAGRGLWQQ